MWLLTALTLPHSSRRSLEKLTPQLTYSKLTANKTWTSGKRKLGLQNRRGMSYFLLLLFFSSALQTRWWWRREKGRHDWWMQAGRGENASPVGFVASGGLKGERSPPHHHHSSSSSSSSSSFFPFSSMTAGAIRGRAVRWEASPRCEKDFPASVR